MYIAFLIYLNSEHYDVSVTDESQLLSSLVLCSFEAAKLACTRWVVVVQFLKNHVASLDPYVLPCSLLESCGYHVNKTRLAHI